MSMGPGFDRLLSDGLTALHWLEKHFYRAHGLSFTFGQSLDDCISHQSTCKHQPVQRRIAYHTRTSVEHSF